ncbi:hypothetical protein PAEPH01_2418 [Pancytospora epiphaga]|nr:hypothetical protein PAEPH01_2418 [Pancytospora epiphaga]
MRSYENLEVFEVSNLMNISKNVIRKIAGCPKLRELKITTNLYSNWIVKYDLKEIGKVVTLEKLALDGIDLSDKGGIELTGLKHLRQLKLRFCRLNNEYLNDMEKLKSLELLDITQNTFDTSMNEILKLKNLRVLKVYGVRFDYDEKGSFNLVKGFEEVECYRWEIYQNGNHITYKDSSSIDILSEMQREATLSNWKGVGKISIWPIDINSALFIAISSKLVFVKNVMLDICTESTLNYDRLEILKNCLALREINWRNCGLRVCLPLSASTSLVNNKPLLQRIEMTVKNLSSELANALLKARYLHTIDLYAEKYSDGFFETLFKRKLNESNVLVSVKIFFTIPITKKTLSIWDVNAIENAMAEGIKVSIDCAEI